MALLVNKQRASRSGGNLQTGSNPYTNNEYSGPSKLDNLYDCLVKSPTRSTTIHLKKAKLKWSSEEFKLVMTAYYEALQTSQKRIPHQTYRICREMVGQAIRKYTAEN